MRIADAEDLFETERNMLEYLMKIGRELMNKLFEESGTGYAGPKIEKENEIQSTIAVSIDATKVRVKLGENVTADGFF